MEMRSAFAAGLADLDDGGEFEPLAYYDQDMDCIRVQLRDCSFREERRNSFFSTLRDNEASGSGQLVGLNIKGISHLFQDLGIPQKGVLLVTDLLDRVVSTFPESSVEEIGKEVRPVLSPFPELRVSFDQATA